MMIESFQDQVKKAEHDPMTFFMTGAELQALNIEIEWLVEGIVPKQSITTFVGPAGYGKSTVCLNIAHAVDQGMPWLGHDVERVPVYVLDWENPLPVIVSRSKDLRLDGVLFWHSSAETPPPKIDSDGYAILKRLPPGLLIVDGHRASQRGDENSSKDTGLIMERWKELRDLGFTIILIHHTQKANSEQFRGSQALEDQADHCLYFYPVKKPGSDDLADINAEDATYFLGTKTKTRYLPVKVYLKRAGEGRFILGEDPDDLKIDAIKNLLSDTAITKTDLIVKIRSELSIGRNEAVRLLDLGTKRKKWTNRHGSNNAILFSSLPVPTSKDVWETGKQKWTVFPGSET